MLNSVSHYRHGRGYKEKLCAICLATCSRSRLVKRKIHLPITGPGNAVLVPAGAVWMHMTCWSRLIGSSTEFKRAKYENSVFVSQGAKYDRLTGRLLQVIR